MKNMQELWTKEIQEQLQQKLDQAAVKGRSQGGRTVSFVEGHYVIQQANEVFGFGGWEDRVLAFEKVQEEVKKGDKGDQWWVSYTCTGSVTALGITRDDVGFGQGIDRDLGQAHESAIKEAATDMLKRCFRSFGMRFGLALYDKTQQNVEKKGPSKAKAPAPAAPAPAPAAPAGEDAPLEGKELQAASKEILGPQVPEGAVAWGYTPKQWPSRDKFQTETNDKQQAALVTLATAKTVVPEYLDPLRSFVLAAYGIPVTERPTAGGTALLYDFIKHAGEDRINQAIEDLEARLAEMQPGMEPGV